MGIKIKCPHCGTYPQHTSLRVRRRWTGRGRKLKTVAVLDAPPHCDSSRSKFSCRNDDSISQKGRNMNIEFKCPQCGKSVECDEAFRGQVAECPHCGKGIVIPREKPRIPKTPMQRNMGGEKASSVHAPNVPSSKSQPNHAKVDTLPIPSETECLKAWAKYWFARLLIAFFVSFGLGFLGGFVGSLTGCTPFTGWPSEFPWRMAHIVVYAALIVGIYVSLRLAWWAYKRFAIRNLLPEHSASNMFSSWLVPILVNAAVNLLMPMGLQIAILGVYGYIVWGFTIWIVIDYLMCLLGGIRKQVRLKLETA